MAVYLTIYNNKYRLKNAEKQNGEIMEGNGLICISFNNCK